MWFKHDSFLTSKPLKTLERKKEKDVFEDMPKISKLTKTARIHKKKTSA
jgi:hypothetical protein